MKMVSMIQNAVLFVLGVSALAIAGCGNQGPAGIGTDNSAVKSEEPLTKVAANWCVEHGVPEDICAQCNAKVAADCKQKGDWCEEHERPESQCFLCDPQREAKFAAEYEAKNGSKPPKPQPN
ncbi:MAG: RND transporter [Pirellulaceae bacterium]